PLKGRRGVPQVPLRHRNAGGLGSHGRLLASMAVQLYLYRPLARNGVAIGADTQTHDLRTDRSDYRLADLQPARVDRRRTELGLSPHLDSRRRLYVVWLLEDRLHGGSASLLAMAGSARR